jgi:hypothetical protein
MRLSYDRKDPGYHEGAMFCEVYLDGERLTNCITADEERGEAICFVQKDGERLRDADGELSREVRHGVVEIRFMPEAPEWVVRELRARG